MIFFWELKMIGKRLSVIRIHYILLRQKKTSLYNGIIELLLMYTWCRRPWDCNTYSYRCCFVFIYQACFTVMHLTVDYAKIGVSWIWTCHKIWNFAFFCILHLSTTRTPAREEYQDTSTNKSTFPFAILSCLVLRERRLSDMLFFIVFFIGHASLPSM